MAHLITLDLDTIPDLRNQQPKLRDARAVAFFINDFKKTFGATEPTSRETALVPLSEEPIAFGDWTGEGIENSKPRGFTPFLVDVPRRMFAAEFDPHEDEEAPLSKLYGEIMSENRADVMETSSFSSASRWWRSISAMPGRCMCSSTRRIGIACS